MQTQVVHQQKATIPWISILVICLIAVGSVFAIGLATHERGTTVTTPTISSVDLGADRQKAAMSAAGIHNLSGTDATTASREGGASGVAGVSPGGGAPHSGVKFGGQSDQGTRDAALQATVTRLEQERAR